MNKNTITFIKAISEACTYLTPSTTQQYHQSVAYFMGRIIQEQAHLITLRSNAKTYGYTRARIVEHLRDAIRYAKQNPSQAEHMITYAEERFTIIEREEYF